MDKAYKDLIEGIDKIGAALLEIGKSEDNKPIKLLVNRLVGNMGFNNPAVGDDIAMLRFAVENDDASLEKLTAELTKPKVAE